MLKISCVAGAGPPRIIFEGKVSASLVGRAFDALLAEPDFAPSSGLVIDVTRQVQERSADEIQALARHMAAQAETFGGRLALILSADSTNQFELARIFAADAESAGLSVAVFTLTKDAVLWIAAATDP